MTDSRSTLFVSDLDGTLLNTNVKLSDYTRDTINSMISQGVQFTYATARSLSSARVVTKGLDVKMPVIVYNGVFIMDPVSEKILYSNSFEEGVCKNVESILDNSNIFPIVYSLINGKQKVSWFTDRENNGISFYISNRQGDSRLRPLQFGEGIYDGDVFYYTCIGERSILEPVYEQLKKINGIRVTFSQELYRSEYWLEIMPAKASKAAAIMELKKMKNFEKLITFGDAANDINMFHISDISLAVENAVQEARNEADQILESNDKDGVARWMIEYLNHDQV